MTGRRLAWTGTKRVAILVICLWLLVAPTVAAIGGVAGQGSQPGGGASTDTADGPSALAGSTTVRLDPTTASVDEGATRTLNVVVTEANGGVGAVAGEISVVESEYAEIVDLELRGDPGVENVTVEGDRVTFEGALMDTPQTGAVTVAEVTVRGQLEGTTDLALSIDSLGDESGEPYDVGGTPDTALTVENTPNEVPLSITADEDAVTVGESLTFTVMRADSDARVAANVTVGNRTVDTGVDGEASVVLRESMVSDAGTVTAVASKEPTSQERYSEDSVTLAVDDGGSGGGTEDGAIVRTDPGSIDLTIGETTTVDLVVTGVDGGVGAGNLTATLTDGGVAEITDATVTGDPGIGGAEITDGGTNVGLEFALREGSEEAPVRIVELTLRGVSSGSTTLSLSASSLGDENGDSYAISAVPDSGIDIRDAGGSDDGSTATATAGGSSGTSAETPTGGTPTADGTGTSAASSDQPTDGAEVPPDPSVALLASAVVAVFLLGLVVVAAS